MAEVGLDGYGSPNPPVALLPALVIGHAYKSPVGMGRSGKQGLVCPVVDPHVIDAVTAAEVDHQPCFDPVAVREATARIPALAYGAVNRACGWRAAPHAVAKYLLPVRHVCAHQVLEGDRASIVGVVACSRARHGRGSAVDRGRARHVLVAGLHGDGAVVQRVSTGIENNLADADTCFFFPRWVEANCW